MISAKYPDMSYQTGPLMKVLILLLIFSFSAQAEVREEKKMNFPIDTKSLMRGNLHVYFNQLSNTKIKKLNKALKRLDSLELLKKNKAADFVIAKFVYVVEKPVGFFDHEHLNNQSYLEATFPQEKVTKLSATHFRINESNSHFEIKNFYDSDDMTTLPNSRVIQAVASARKLDVISQGSFSIVFREMFNFSDKTLGGEIVTSYIPLKENKTLVIMYQLMAYSKVPANIKAALIAESLDHQTALNKMSLELKP